MKKFTTLFALAFIVVGSAFAQQAISGAIFASNPARFNGRTVTVKNVQLNMTNVTSTTGTVAPGAAGVQAGPAGPAHGAPGPNGAGTAVVRCNPPKGYQKLDVDFIEEPDYQGCFFMKEVMFNQLKKETGMQEKVDVQLTFRGDAKVGYMVTFYKLGK